MTKQDNLLSKRFDVFWSDKVRLDSSFKKPEKWFLDFAENLGKKNLKVLDLGCGNGRNAIPLAMMGYHVTAVDISQVALDLLSEKALNNNVKVEAILGNILGLPFQCNIFDLAICYNSIFNGTKIDIEKSVVEAKRVLKPNGFFLFTLRSKKNPIPTDAKPTDERNTYKMIKDGYLLTTHYSDDDEIDNLLIGWKKLSSTEFLEVLGKGDDAKPVITIKLELQKPEN